MKIGMDTDAVRSMSARLRQTADSMDTKLASIKSTVASAGWQSQAREEFIMHLETLRRSSVQSAAAMRMMATAADRKAEQWEAIANIFNGPFHYLGDIWSSVRSFFSGIGSGIWNAITSIRLPSVPNYVFPPLSGVLIIGGISVLQPGWTWEKPDWLKKILEKEKTAGGGVGGSGGRSWGEEEPTVVDDGGEVPEDSASTAIPIKTPPTGYDKDNLLDGEYLKADFNIYPPVPKGRTTWKGHCAGYVQALVPGIKTPSVSGDPPLSRAGNWIKDYDLDPFAPVSDLRTQLEPGDVVVWPATHQSCQNNDGHAAVIIEVHKDHVVLAESAWETDKYPKSPRDDRILMTNKLSDGLYVWSNPDLGSDKIQVGRKPN